LTVHIHLCESLGAPPDRVWADIRHLETHGEWMVDAQEVRFRSEQREGVGTVLDNVTRVGPFHTRDVVRVTEWEPERAMTIEHVGAVTGTGRFTLVADGSCTRFCWDEVLRFPWWLGGPLGERIGRPVLRRVWRGNLRRLKERVDRE
jgi:hypothetical protein